MSGGVVEMVGAGTFMVRHPSCGTQVVCDLERPHVTCTCGELTVDFNGGVPAIVVDSAVAAS